MNSLGYPTHSLFIALSVDLSLSEPLYAKEKVIGRERTCLLDPQQMLGLNWIWRAARNTAATRLIRERGGWFPPYLHFLICLCFLYLSHLKWYFAEDIVKREAFLVSTAGYDFSCRIQRELLVIVCHSWPEFVELCSEWTMDTWSFDLH